MRRGEDEKGRRGEREKGRRGEREKVSCPKIGLH